MDEHITEELLERIKNKDEDAFRIFYENTHKKIFHYLLRLMNNRAVSEDLLMMTYVEVWKSIGKYRKESGILAWVAGIARHLAMSEHRKKGIIDDTEVDYSTFPCTADQSRDYAHSEKAVLLKKALNHLPSKHREILDLVFLQEMRYEEISRIVGIPVGTVKTRVFHAKNNLSNVLIEMGVTKDDLG